VLVDGAIAAAASRGGRQLTALLPDEEPARSRVAQAAARALSAWCGATGRSALGWAVGEEPPLSDSPLAPFLAAAGFVRSGPGVRLATMPPDAADHEEEGA
jgi:hypothetical protein